MTVIPSPVDPPLSLEPVVGWRVWGLERIDGALLLRSPARSDRWPPRQAMEARCTRPHPSTSPTPGCFCGLYAASSPENLARSGVFRSAPGVIGATAMWGTVIEHARGTRSRFAYPARLGLVCGPCLKQGFGAVEPVSVIGGEGPLKVVCRRHRFGLQGPVRPPAEIQAELLSTYGVELLPIERVASGLRSGPGRIAQPSGRLFHMALTGSFRLLRLVLGVVIAMWVIGLALTVAAAVIGGVVHVFAGGSDAHRAAPPSFVAPSPTPNTHLRVTPPAEINEPYRGGIPAPPPKVPRIAILCGVGRGSRVELVTCKDEGSDLIGFAELTEPKGARTDCIKGWDAYSRGHHYWICWESFGDGAFVHRWANAPNPFTTPREEGGAADEHR